MKNINGWDAFILAGLLIGFSWMLGILVIAILAVSFCWVWNLTLAPMGAPPIGFLRAAGLLLLWVILRCAGESVKISASLRG